MRTIGILGELGPEATSQIYLSIVRKMLKATGSLPRIIIWNVPISQMKDQCLISCSEASDSIVERYLEEGLERLTAGGAEFAIIPCNSAHGSLPQSTPIPILSILDACVAACNRAKVQKIVVLASNTTSKLNLYRRPLESGGIKVIDLLPTEQDFVVACILESLEEVTDSLKVRFKQFVQRVYIKTGVDSFILGCTELPLLIKQGDLKGINLFDTLEILANASCVEASCV